MIKFELNQKSGKKINIKELQKIIKGAGKILKPAKKMYFSLAVVDEKEIKKLNRLYRKKNEPTDVLSFPFIESSDLEKSQEKDLGEIVIAYDVAKKQADEKGIKLIEEIKILLIHGLLHLFGYDHIKKSDRLIMNRLEARILLGK